MLTLAIEISNPSAWTPGAAWSPGVALGRVYRRDRVDVPAGHGAAGTIVRDDVLVELLGVEPIDASKRHDDELMPAIATLCERAGVRPSELERVAVSTGPGGYTGLRIAVTTAKFIAEATGAGCIGVASASVAARRVQRAGRFGVALASKGPAAFITVFDGIVPEGPGRSMLAGDLPALKITTLVGDRFLPAEMTAWARSAGVAILEPVLDPVACLEAAATGTIVDPAQLTPIYAREPEAVTKWRQLHPR